MLFVNRVMPGRNTKKRRFLHFSKDPRDSSLFLVSQLGIIHCQFLPETSGSRVSAHLAMVSATCASSPAYIWSAC